MVKDMKKSEEPSLAGCGQVVTPELLTAAEAYTGDVHKESLHKADG